MLDELLREARGWLADCGYARVGDSDLLIAHLIYTHYQGGWPAFVLADSDYNIPVVWLLMVRRFGLPTANFFFPSHACEHPDVFARGPVPGTEHCYHCDTDVSRQLL